MHCYKQQVRIPKQHRHSVYNSSVQAHYALQGDKMYSIELDIDIKVGSGKFLVTDMIAINLTMIDSVPNLTF